VSIKLLSPSPSLTVFLWRRDCNETLDEKEDQDSVLLTPKKGKTWRWRGWW
jgi:hypothetical protein